MGFKHPDPAASVIIIIIILTQDLQGEAGPRLLRLTVAHVKHGHLVTLSHRHAAVAGDSVMSAATVPLPRVDLELPGEAPVEDKRASLVVLITPTEQIGRNLLLYHDGLKVKPEDLQVKQVSYLPSRVMT